MTTTTTVNKVTLLGVGRMNLLAISGGRVRFLDDTTIELPVRYGYSVVIAYDAGADLYNVSRVFTRGAKRWIKKVWTGVYVDALGDTAYRASCYLDD